MLCLDFFYCLLMPINWFLPVEGGRGRGVMELSKERSNF